jgi:DNA-binding GntR family transcriptional regulator
MKPLTARPGLTEQVYQSLLDEICEGRLVAGTHLVQEDLAADLGVSRQPVQQALAMLKNDGLVHEQGKRGLSVAPLDAASMRHHYEIRAALDGLAARRAAERAALSRDVRTEIEREGAAILSEGRRAIARDSIADMIRADTAFHDFIYRASGNPLLAPTAALHWRQLRRVMGEVLRHAEPPEMIWRQHADILAAITRGEPERAEVAAIVHVRTAAERLERTLSPPPPSRAAPSPGQSKGRSKAPRSNRSH